MMKVKCTCGALLSVEEGLARFRCPQCQRVLKLPAGGGGGGNPSASVSPTGVEEGAPAGRSSRSRLWSRLHLALAGAILVALLAPIQADRAVFDQLLASAKEPKGLDLLGMARLLLPLGALLALVGAALPLRTARGAMVAATGGAMLILTFGQLIALGPTLPGELGLFKLVPHHQALAYGTLGALLAALLAAAAQTRSYAPHLAGARTISVLGGLALALLAGAFLCTYRDLLTKDALKQMVGTNLASLYGYPTSGTDQALKYMPYAYATAAGAGALLAVLSIFGFARARWLACVTGLVGMLALLVVPLAAIGFGAPHWQGGGTAVLEGSRKLLFRLATIWAPVILVWLGLRDYLSERLRDLGAAADEPPPVPEEI